MLHGRWRTLLALRHSMKPKVSKKDENTHTDSANYLVSRRVAGDKIVRCTESGERSHLRHHRFTVDVHAIPKERDRDEKRWSKGDRRRAVPRRQVRHMFCSPISNLYPCVDSKAFSRPQKMRFMQITFEIEKRCRSPSEKSI